MSFGVLVETLLFLILFASSVGLWIKISRPAKDDPRLSRGLQILQSKISVLEDLSDRTEKQVNQLTTLLEQKIKEVQNKISEADKSVQRIEMSRSKSIEVAKIFEDKIPHQEIIERQNTLKYIRAAQLAHQGVPLEQIASQVELSRGELEFIVKVNRDQLQFSIEDLPDWAKEGLLESNLTKRPVVTQTKIQLSELGEKFRKAIPQESLSLRAQATDHMPPVIENIKVSDKKTAAEPEIKKVVFPRIDINRNLG